MRILVTGASGFLGRALVHGLEASGEVVGQGHRHAGPSDLRVDLRDPGAVRGLLREARPDVVVHGAAYRDPDFCEKNPEETRRLNVDPVRVFAEELPPKCRLLFVSSDYVFDGAHGPYAETDAREPVNVYGRSKVEAEDIALERPGTLVLRIPLLMGAGPSWEESGFLFKTARLIQEGQPAELEDIGVRVPTLIEDVAGAVDFLLRKRATGVYHFSGQDTGTKYGFALRLAELLGAPADHITPARQPITVARRPDNSTLRTGKIRELGYSHFTAFDTAAREVLGRFGQLDPAHS